MFWTLGDCVDKRVYCGGELAVIVCFLPVCFLSAEKTHLSWKFSWRVTLMTFRSMNTRSQAPVLEITNLIRPCTNPWLLLSDVIALVISAETMQWVTDISYTSPAEWTLGSDPHPWSLRPLLSPFFTSLIPNHFFLKHSSPVDSPWIFTFLQGKRLSGTEFLYLTLTYPIAFPLGHFIVLYFLFPSLLSRAFQYQNLPWVIEKQGESPGVMVEDWGVGDTEKKTNHCFRRGWEVAWAISPSSPWPIPLLWPSVVLYLLFSSSA